MAVEEILSRLIQVKSVNPPGGETEVARYLKGLFDQAGIANEIIESAPGRGSFLAYLGEGPKSLLFLSHTDVVPAGEGWDFDPFSGEIVEGYVRGRGALDCKGLVAAEAQALLSLALGPRLRGRLIFAATADEEIGGTYGVQYLLEKFPHKLRADFAINEGGEEPIKMDGQAVFFIQTGEKGASWTHLQARGVSAHGSIPTLGENAVVKMAEAVRRLGRCRPRVVLIPEVRRLIQALIRFRGVEEKITSRNVDTFLDAFFEGGAFREYLRAITRLTISPNMIQGGLKTNIIPDSCTAEIDIRVLPGQDREFVLRELRRLVGPDIEIDIPDFHAASFSPADTEGYRLIERAIQEVSGQVACLPCVSSGATDSRFLRAAGIPAYGLAIMAPDFEKGIVATMHGRNERLDIKSLRAKTDFLLRLAQNYLG